ncbi:MAG TPA: aliphatic sulfonate ABC transporter substrate-binding protein [Stellaceae bacterium]|nr:aliphatic sulfonate ABC transporter substrate-binding protein [Stellaceae bacterium]
MHGPTIDFPFCELLAPMRERPPTDDAVPMLERASSPRRSPAFAAVLLLSLALPIVAAALVPANADESAQHLRIGYQKWGTLAVLRQKPELAERLARRAAIIDWVEFPSGASLLKALAAGSIDFGYSGDTPPIFAEAAGARFVYVGYLANPGRNFALLVRRDAPFASVKDLKGRRIAFTKGSSVQHFVVKALAAAGLRYDEITPAYLQPADAAAAFRAGRVDAWAIRDPFYAETERAEAVRVLTTAEGVAPSNSFFLARRDYAERHPEVIIDLVRDLDDASRWSESHQDATAQILAALTGVTYEDERASVARASYGVRFLTPTAIARQQAIADTFQTLGLIPARIDVAKAVWIRPGLTAAATSR